MSSSGPPELKRFAVVLRVCLFGILLVGVAVMTGALYLGAYHGFSLQAIEETILSWGAWGVLASIGLMILHSTSIPVIPGLGRFLDVLQPPTTNCPALLGCVPSPNALALIGLDSPRQALSGYRTG